MELVPDTAWGFRDWIGNIFEWDEGFARGSRAAFGRIPVNNDPRGFSSLKSEICIRDVLYHMLHMKAELRSFILVDKFMVLLN